jgi:hypothetical protein
VVGEGLLFCCSAFANADASMLEIADPPPSGLYAKETQKARKYEKKEVDNFN